MFTETRELPEPRWVMGGLDSWASDWVSLLDTREVCLFSHETLVNGDFNLHEKWAHSNAICAGDRLFLR